MDLDTGLWDPDLSEWSRTKGLPGHTRSHVESSDRGPGEMSSMWGRGVGAVVRSREVRDLRPSRRSLFRSLHGLQWVVGGPEGVTVCE